MALSEIWTLRSDSNPGDERTLSGWGVESADLSRRSLDADELVLAMPVANAGAAVEPWEWEEPITLLRDGAVYFRGYATGFRASATAGRSGHEYVISNVWDLLARTNVVQDWATDSQPIQSGRVRVGRGFTALQNPTSAMLQEVAAMAQNAGIDVSFDLSNFRARNLVDVEDDNVYFAELIRRIMRWHPTVAVVADYSADGTVLRFVDYDKMSTLSIATEGQPVTEWSLRPRHDLVVDAVRVTYQLAVPKVDVSSTGAVNWSREGHVDLFPEDATFTRRSLQVTLPVAWNPQEEEAGGYPETRLSGGQAVPITTGPLPADGAFDSEAEKWWVDKLNLQSFGLSEADIILPRRTQGNVKAHSIVMSNPLANVAPTPLNPNSTPVFRPATVADLPRELLEGQLADWMGVYFENVHCTCTVAVRASTVDGFPEERREEFMRHVVGSAKVEGVTAYLLEGNVSTVGTDAVTKEYSKLGRYEVIQPDNEVEDAEDLQEAIRDAIVDGLAEDLWRERSVLPWEGEAVLVGQDVGALEWLGNKVNFSDPNRSEWGSMNGLLQEVRFDLASGSTALSFGPANHLTIQDRIELSRAVRDLVDSFQKFTDGNDRETESGGGPDPGGNPGISPDENEDEKEAARLVNVGGRKGPNSSASFVAPAAILRPWDLVPTQDGLRVVLGRILGREAGGSRAVSSVLTPPTEPVYDVSAGDTLGLFIRDEFPTTYTIEKFTDWPNPDGALIGFDGVGVNAVFSQAVFPLWQFYADNDRSESRVSLGPDLWGVKLAMDNHFRVEHSQYQIGEGDTAAWIMGPVLEPWFGGTV